MSGLGELWREDQAMRTFATIILVSLCAIAWARPAAAVEELKSCDGIQDAAQRMVCLQAHISHLEQTLLNLNAEIVDLNHALKAKLAATDEYKLQYVGKDSCLGFSADNQPPAMKTCDHPDSWKLVPGSQKPQKPAQAGAALGPPANPGSASSPAEPTKEHPQESVVPKLN
jgi:hypothetical protein